MLGGKKSTAAKILISTIKSLKLKVRNGSLTLKRYRPQHFSRRTVVATRLQFIKNRNARLSPFRFSGHTLVFILSVVERLRLPVVARIRDTGYSRRTIVSILPWWRQYSVVLGWFRALFVKTASTKTAVDTVVDELLNLDFGTSGRIAAFRRAVLDLAVQSRFFVHFRWFRNRRVQAKKINHIKFKSAALPFRTSSFKLASDRFFKNTSFLFKHRFGKTNYAPKGHKKSLVRVSVRRF